MIFFTTFLISAHTIEDALNIKKHLRTESIQDISINDNDQPSISRTLIENLQASIRSSKEESAALNSISSDTQASSEPENAKLVVNQEPTPAPTESDAPHSPSEEPSEAKSVSLPALEELVQEKATIAPTKFVTTSKPTPEPSRVPTLQPSSKPTPQPSFNPTPKPSTTPSEKPSPSLTHKPTLSPTVQKTLSPTFAVPTEAPTESDAPHSPSEEPTEAQATKKPIAAEPIIIGGNDDRVYTPSPTKPHRDHKKRHPTPEPSPPPSPSTKEADTSNTAISAEPTTAPPTDAPVEPAEEKSVTSTDDDESQIQSDLSNFALLLLGAILAVLLVRRCWTTCARGLSEPADAHTAVAQYTPVNVHSDVEELDGIRMGTVTTAPVRHSRSHFQSGSTMQEAESRDGWGGADDDLFFEPSESQDPSLRSQQADDDEWDDSFDPEPLAAPAAMMAATAERKAADPPPERQKASAVEDADSLFSAVMSGKDYPSSAAGGSSSSASSERTSRFQKSTPSAPGTTSQAGVKVIKGVSLKDAFAKGKK